MSYGKTTVKCSNCEIPVVYEGVALDTEPGKEQQYLHKLSRAGIRVEANTLELAIAKLCSEIEKLRAKNRRKAT